MKITKNVKNFDSIPTIGNIPTGTVFSMDVDNNKSVWFKPDHEDLIICLETGEVLDLECTGDAYLGYQTPVHILNAVMTVEN